MLGERWHSPFRRATFRASPPGEAVRITREVALALDFTHRHGVVHRDIKPENILLTDGQALVADFGVARALDAAGESRLMEPGLVVGTPAYMSPEQATGASVEARSDQYSLAKRLAGPAPSVRTLRPDVPAELEATLQRALAQVPAARFASSRELAEQLAVPASRPRPRWRLTSPRPAMRSSGSAGAVDRDVVRLRRQRLLRSG